MIVWIRFSSAKEDSGKGSPPCSRRSHPGVSSGRGGAEKQKGYDKIEPHALLLQGFFLVALLVIRCNGYRKYAQQVIHTTKLLPWFESTELSLTLISLRSLPPSTSETSVKPF